MKNQKLLGFVLSLAPLVSVGCSDPVGTTGGSPDASTTGATITADNFVAEMSAAVCRSYFACPETGDNVLIQVLMGNATNCMTRIRTITDVAYADLVAQVRAGRVRIDSAAARRCLDALSTGCGGNGDLEKLCADAVIGMVAQGQGCWRNFDCAPGLYCDHSDPSMRRCPGVCAPRKSLGAECSNDRECAVPSDGAPTCFNDHCASLRTETPAVEGAQCGTLGGTGTTAQSVGCATGFACVRAAMGSGQTCQRVLSEGTPCQSSEPCAVGLACVPGQGTTTRTCQRVTPARAGEMCSASGLPICNALDRLECGPTRVCNLVGAGTVGAHCRRGDIYSMITCNAGLYCRPGDFTCQPRLAVGAACGEDLDCTSNECSSGHCLERPCD